MQETAGRFFDGRTARQHDVHVVLSPDRLALDITGDTIEGPLRWLLSDLRATGDHAEERQLVLTYHAHTDDEAPRDLARLIIDDAEAVTWIKKSRPNLYRADLRKGTGKRIARNAGLAVGALVLMLFVILPAMANTLAQLIPLEREVAFGRTIVAQMEQVLGADEVGELVCSNEEGEAALQVMLARLTEGREFDYDLDVRVFDHGMVNAFAAPGGQIVLLRGLIEDASGPDAVAAVLAHEIAHVVNRDPTRAALRTAGSAGLLSLVLGDVTGGVILVALTEQVMNSAYSREAETLADDYAHDMLNTSGVSVEAMGGFFDQLSDLEGDFSLPSYLSTHPETEARAENARRFAQGQGETTPALGADDWAALQGICD